MTYMKTCEQDGVCFEAAREHARFCSSNCRVAWFRAHADEDKPVTRNTSRIGELDDLSAFLLSAEQGLLTRCVLDSLFTVLPETAEGSEWLREALAGLRMRDAATIMDEYLRHFSASVLLSRTFWEIWHLGYQAGADSAAAAPGAAKSTATIVAQIAEMAARLETRNAEAFFARTRSDDREAVAEKLKSAAATLQAWSEAID